jgi:hypothetical protein
MTPPAPFVPFGNAMVPAGLVPMKFPVIMLPLEKTSIASCTNLLMTNPRTMQFGALMMRPLKLFCCDEFTPLSSIFNTVLRPIVGGFVFAVAPDWV